MVLYLKIDGCTVHSPALQAPPLASAGSSLCTVEAQQQTWHEAAAFGKFRIPTWAPGRIQKADPS